MNSLYTLALRQSSSLQTDLTALEQSYLPTGSTSSTASLNGQINASLAALDRTVEDYDSMARREIVEAKRDKALSRVARFKDDYIALRKQYERIKSTGANQKASADRDALLSSSSAVASSYSSSSNSRLSRIPGSPVAESPFTINMNGGASPRYAPNNPYPPNDSGFAGSVHNNSRTKHALDESSFMASTGATLDAYIAQGQAVLGGLAAQKDVLKGTKRKLLSAANTLGLSRSTIQYIERRTKGDYYILLGGGAFTLLCFYFILKWFG